MATTDVTWAVESGGREAMLEVEDATSFVVIRQATVSE